MERQKKHTHYTQREAIQRATQYIERSRTKRVKTKVVTLTGILLYISIV